MKGSQKRNPSEPRATRGPTPREMAALAGFVAAGASLAVMTGVADEAEIDARGYMGGVGIGVSAPPYMGGV